MVDGISVNGRFLTQPLTGVQRYALNLVSRLPSLDVIAPSAPVAGYEAVAASRVVLAPSRLRSLAWEQVVLPRAARAARLIWSPTGAGPVMSARHVLTMHDVCVLEHPEYYARGYALAYRALWRIVARRAARIITVSDYSRERIIEMLRVSPDRLAVTHLGVDARFRPPPPEAVERARRRFGLMGRYVLSVGALSERKNLGRVLEAWRRVQPTTDATLLLVGQGGLAFSTMAGLSGLPPRAVHVPHVDDETLIALYGGASAFLYPSLYEGFGLPILEAMAVGAPVITSNVTAMPEVAGDAALLVDPFDVDDIARAVRRVLDDGELAADLRARGTRRAMCFDWDRTARQTAEILEGAA
jgi:glycosyltransferase involved in cell wall biosynthesis